jgi:putative flavoprotein involved in K+ transport
MSVVRDETVKASLYSDAECCKLVSAWFKRFRTELERSNFSALRDLLGDDCYWRDLLTFGWKLQTTHGIPQICSWLDRSYRHDPAQDLRLIGECSQGRLGDVFTHTIESFFDFETRIATGRGYLRLIVDPNAPAGARAITILTAMRELKDFPEPIKQRRPREPWMVFDDKAKSSKSVGTNPDVLIIGAGQAGIMLAARLCHNGIDTLLVDRMSRVGDIWRSRYRALKLHNETCMNHFPYMPFPETWPVYLPRDYVANWLEFYATSMNLKIAHDTTCLGGSFSAGTGTWAIRLQHKNGAEYTLNPKHIVLATGVSGFPDMPKIEGADSFAGTIVHSSEVNEGFDVSGKRVVVVGAGTSAHDIAQMSYVNGADVTMIQRSPITVVSLEPSAALPFEIYRRNDGVKNIDDVDLIYASVPYDLVRRLQVGMSKQMMKLDEKLLSGLRKRGFLLDNGEDDTGWVMKLIRYQAGYYLNVGASDLIAEGKIKLKPGVGLSKFEGSSIIFSDGTKLDADIVVFATGYRPLEETVARLFGNEVADRVGPVYGLGDDGELRNMYARTGHPNFYVTGGGFAGARSYSRYLTLLIKAQLEGLLSPDMERAEPPRRTAQSGRVIAHGVHL